MMEKVHYIQGFPSNTNAGTIAVATTDSKVYLLSFVSEQNIDVYKVCKGYYL